MTLHSWVADGQNFKSNNKSSGKKVKFIPSKSEEYLQETKDNLVHCLGFLGGVERDLKNKWKTRVIGR